MAYLEGWVQNRKFFIALLLSAGASPPHCFHLPNWLQQQGGGATHTVQWEAVKKPLVLHPSGYATVLKHLGKYAHTIHWGGYLNGCCKKCLTTYVCITWFSLKFTYMARGGNCWMHGCMQNMQLEAFYKENKNHTIWKFLHVCLNCRKLIC